MYLTEGTSIDLHARRNVFERLSQSETEIRCFSTVTCKHLTG